MRIIYQDQEIHIEPKKIKTSVKDLLNYLKPKINSSPEEDLILLEKNSEILDKYTYLDDLAELDLDNKNNIAEYIIISVQSSHYEEKTKEETIEKLIMLVTNAKSVIKPVKPQKKKYLSADDNMEYIEQILSGGNFPISSLRLRSEIVNLINNPFMNEGNLPSFIPSFNTSNSSNNTTNTNNLTANIIPNNSINIRHVRPPSIEPNPIFVQNLIDMGFPEDRAKRALAASNNNLNHATEMILNGYDLELSENSNIYGANYSHIYNNIQIQQNDNNNLNTNENQNSQENQLMNNEEGNEEEGNDEEEFEGADDMY